MTTVHLLQAFPAVAEKYRRRFRHVLVDEYQDTNQAQYTLVKELVAKHQPGVLLVTHDVDEAIVLADRAMVMRDGAIACEYAVSADARAHRSHPDAIALRDRLLFELGVDEGQIAA